MKCGSQCLAIVAMLVLAGLGSAARGAEPLLIAGHVAQFDAAGKLLPWIDWPTALERELSFYREAPEDHGYPRFVTETFLETDWTPDPARHDTIPATQNGMGIISYLKLYARSDAHAESELATARAMGNYLLHEALTPETGSYPRFTRSTGTRGQFPLASDSGSQSDEPYEIEPDKGGIAGYALLLLFRATHEAAYLDQALHNARVLAPPGPWRCQPLAVAVPRRLSERGSVDGAVSGNMSFSLGLRWVAGARLWRISHPPAAAVALDQGLSDSQCCRPGPAVLQFFEDHDAPGNRNAWAPLNLARYLLEQRAALDPEWRADAGTLIQFVRRSFTHQEFGVTVCHEQDEDLEAWGGVNSTYGAVLALYAKAIDSAAPG